jgi:RimJ/RimL family protein N-acetyltransferase
MTTQTSRLETRRLWIRSIRQDDLEEIFQQIFSDPDTQLRMANKPMSLDEMKNHFAKKHIDRTDGFGYRMVILKKTDQIIGLIGFKPHTGNFNKPSSIGRDSDLIFLEKELGQAELIYIFPRHAKGKGYTLEAARAMVAHGFRDLHFFRIVKAVRRRNMGSFLSMRRLGFRIAATPRPESKNKEAQPDIVGLLECFRIF